MMLKSRHISLFIFFALRSSVFASLNDSPWGRVRRERLFPSCFFLTREPPCRHRSITSTSQSESKFPKYWSVGSAGRFPGQKEAAWKQALAPYPAPRRFVQGGEHP